MKPIYIDNIEVKNYSIERTNQGYATIFIPEQHPHAVPTKWLDAQAGICHTGGHRYSHHAPTHEAKS